MLITILLVISTLLFITHYVRRRTHPPGPIGLPIFGIFPYKVAEIIFSKFFSEPTLIEFFRSMKTKFGSIWSMEINGQRFITLASLDVIREAFIDGGTFFYDFPKDKYCYIMGENRGILFIGGDIWKNNRALAIKSLRNFDIEKIQLETRICEEADNLILTLENNSNLPVNTELLFCKSISNITSYINFNEINENNFEFDKYICDTIFLARSSIINIIVLCPAFFLSKLGRYIFKGIDNYLNIVTNNRKFVLMKCIKRVKDFNRSLDPECVFDYLWTYKDDYDFYDDKNEDFKFLNIVQTLVDLQNAGTQTTNAFLVCCCLILGKNRNLQNDLRNELKEQIDDYSQITLNIRKKCTKLLSFFDEVHRYFCIIPKLFHCPTEKCSFRGYKMYPNDVIFADLATMFKDETLFENPDLFDPNRFLDETQTKYIPNKNLMAFGMGKRKCLGENIANMEIFLILSRIIYKFQITLPKATNKNLEKILKGEIGVIHSILSHELNFNPLK